MSRKKYWTQVSELPKEVFEILRKPNRSINPITIVATVDPDGAPRTAPFGSVRAINPRVLRLTSWYGHDTCSNLRRDGRVMVALLAPPDLAVGILGRAKVLREKMIADEQHVSLEINIKAVKNDMVRRVKIETAPSVSIITGFQDWFNAVLGEIEDL